MMKRPSFQHLNHMTPDVINLIIYLVLKKDGEVMVVENGELKDFNRLVLIARYQTWVMFRMNTL